jgi:hypothetical protein
VKDDKQKVSITSGDEMLKKYLHWVAKNQTDLNLDSEEKTILAIVSVHLLTWNLKRKRISIENFKENRINEKTLRIKRASLTDKGLIKWKMTNDCAIYELILPEDITDRYEFIYLKNPLEASVSYMLKRLEDDNIELNIDNIYTIKRYKKDNEVCEKCESSDEAIDFILEPLIKSKKEIEKMSYGLLAL